MGSPLEVLANYNPTGFALANQQRQAQLAQTSQQTQALQLENVLRQRQIKDADALTKAWANVDTTAPLDEQQRQLTRGVIANGGSGQAVIGVGQNYADLRTKYATATKDELANEAAIHDRNAGTINSIIQGPPEDQQASWAEALPRLKADYPGGVFPDQYPGNERATALMNQSLHLSTQVANAQKQSETGKAVAETGEAIAKGKEATAAAAQKTAETQLLQKQLDAMAAAAQAPGATRYQFIDNEIDPNKSPGHAALNRAARATYDSLLGAGAKVEDAVKGVAPFATQAAILSREADPNVLEARRKNEILTRVGTQAAIAATGGTAFSNILDSTARAQAEADYKKTSEDYAIKVGAARQVQDFVQAAQSGNKAAPGLIPISLVRELVNRVNRQELQSVSGAAGSAWDRLQGVWYGLKDGEPIPPAVLRDIGTISSVMERAAKRTYTDNVAVNRRTYNSKAEPITLPSEAETAAPTGAPAGGPAPEQPTHRYNPQTRRIEAVQ